MGKTTRKIFEYQIVADVQAINKLNIYGDYYAGTFTVESNPKDPRTQIIGFQGPKTINILIMVLVP